MVIERRCPPNRVLRSLYFFSVVHEGEQKSLPSSKRSPFDPNAPSVVGKIREALKCYNADDEILTSISWAPKHMVEDEELDKKWVLNIATDATHLRNDTGGNIFDAIIKDANGEICPMLVTVSIFKESYVSWKYFFNLLHTKYGRAVDREGTEAAFIADGDKGCRKAFKEVWSNKVLLFACFRHLRDVIRKANGQHGAHEAQLFKMAVHASTEAEVELLFQKMSEKTKSKLKGYERKEWSLVYAKKLHGNSSSNTSEGWHRLVLLARGLDLICEFILVLSRPSTPPVSSAFPLCSAAHLPIPPLLLPTQKELHKN